MSSMILYIGSEHVIQEPRFDVMKDSPNRLEHWRAKSMSAFSRRCVQLIPSEPVAFDNL